ncbi:MAG: glutathionyl-hydroquinone reductase, partial [Kiritimatiellia bacterium]
MHYTPDQLLALVHAARDATTQETYERSARAVFAALDQLDEELQSQRYLGGARAAEEDYELYAFLLRFELIYYALYKLNLRRIRDYPNLGQYLLDMHTLRPEPNVRSVRREAWLTDTFRNPKGVVPLGLPDLDAPHDRLRFDRAALVLAGAQQSKDDALKGEFVRGVSAHRRWIGRELPPEAGRYHLIIANNCPWCHRTALARAMKGLQDTISVGVLYYRRDPDQGWQFRGDLPGFEPDAIHGYRWV